MPIGLSARSGTPTAPAGASRRAAGTRRCPVVRVAGQGAAPLSSRQRSVDGHPAPATPDTRGARGPASRRPESYARHGLSGTTGTPNLRRPRLRSRRRLAAQVRRMPRADRAAETGPLAGDLPPLRLSEDDARTDILHPSRPTPAWSRDLLPAHPGPTRRPASVFQLGRDPDPLPSAPHVGRQAPREGPARAAGRPRSRDGTVAKATRSPFTSPAPALEVEAPACQGRNRRGPGLSIPVAPRRATAGTTFPRLPHPDP